MAYHPDHGLQLTALGPSQLFEAHQSMSVLDLLKNPMVLMMAVPLLLMTVMSKVTPQLSPEEMAVRN